MKLHPIQEYYLNSLLERAAFEDVLTPKIPTGVGKYYIYVELAKRLAPKTVTILCSVMLKAHLEQLIKKSGIANLSINKTHTDFIINDRVHE